MVTSTLSAPFRFLAFVVRPVPQLVATSFVTSFDTGRTSPCVFQCDDKNGRHVGEYVVKLRGKLETANAGLLRELIGNLMAAELGRNVPDPAIVLITKDVEEAIPVQKKEVKAAVRKSVGLNFGSKYLAGGYTTWLPDKTVPDRMFDEAVEIFVYDALIQNPDRRVDKPNLLSKSNEFVLIDHEMAFSFLLDVLPLPFQWKATSQQYLRNHVFYSNLHRNHLNLDRIQQAIMNLDESFWKQCESVTPTEWRGSEFDRIKAHVNTVRET